MEAEADVDEDRFRPESPMFRLNMCSSKSSLSFRDSYFGEDMYFLIVPLVGSDGKVGNEGIVGKVGIEGIEGRLKLFDDVVLLIPADSSFGRLSTVLSPVISAVLLDRGRPVIPDKLNARRDPLLLLFFLPSSPVSLPASLELVASPLSLLPMNLPRSEEDLERALPAFKFSTSLPAMPVPFPLPSPLNLAESDAIWCGEPGIAIDPC